MKITKKGELNLSVKIGGRHSSLVTSHRVNRPHCNRWWNAFFLITLPQV